MALSCNHTGPPSPSQHRSDQGPVYPGHPVLEECQLVEFQVPEPGGSELCEGEEVLAVSGFGDLLGRACSVHVLVHILYQWKLERSPRDSG